MKVFPSLAPGQFVGPVPATISISAGVGGDAAWSLDTCTLPGGDKKQTWNITTSTVINSTEQNRTNNNT